MSNFYGSGRSDSAEFFSEAVGLDDAGSFLSGIVHAIGSAASSVAHAAEAVTKPISTIVTQGTHLLEGGLKALTNNPLWDIARTGVSFIPGVGTAVSAGMAGAAALGRGASISDIGLAAARGALPGGPAIQAAFDVAQGLVKGRNVTDAILQAARSQVPGGAVGQAAFDAATAIAHGHALNDVAIQAIRNGVPGGALGKQAFDTAIAQFRQAKGKATPLRMPNLNLAQSRVAQAIHATPALRSVPVRQLAPRLDTTERNARTVIAEFMNRFSGTPNYDFRDVGDADSLESCCARENIPMESGDPSTGVTFGKVRVLPRIRVPLSRSYLLALYQHGSTNIRKALLAHGHLARVAHATGELDGKGGWIIRSGESPFSIAQKVTGNGNRWREIMAVNPQLSLRTVNGVTQATPFNPGQRITLPASWLGTAAPLPVPAAPSSLPAAVPAASTQPMLQKGSKGPAVSLLQARLGITVDGDFGDQTDAAVRKFQSSHGLLADGVVGPKTWAALLASAPVTSPASTPVPSPPVAAPATANAATVGAVQAALAFFYQRHGGEVPSGQFSSSSTPTYGSDPADLAGVWTDRSVEAMIGFQAWRNAHPVAGVAPLPETGQPDQLSVNALLAQNAQDLAGLGASVPAIPATIPAVTIPEVGPIVPASFPGSVVVPPQGTPATRPVAPGASSPSSPSSAPRTNAAAAATGGDDTGIILAIVGGALLLAGSRKKAA